MMRALGRRKWRERVPFRVAEAWAGAPSFANGDFRGTDAMLGAGADQSETKKKDKTYLSRLTTFRDDLLVKFERVGVLGCGRDPRTKDLQTDALLHSSLFLQWAAMPWTNLDGQKSKTNEITMGIVKLGPRKGAFV